MKNKGFHFSNPSNRNLYAEFIYTDSNLWLDVFNDDRRGHSTSKKFLQDIYSSDNTLLVYSDHTLFEIKNALRESITFEKFPEKKKFKNLNLEQQKLIEIIVDEEYKKITKIFNPVSEQLSYNPLHITNNTIEISKTFDYRVHNEDSKHLAVMKENGINSIATSDKEIFNHTEGLNVYGHNKSIWHHQNTINDKTLNDFEIFNGIVENFKLSDEEK